MAFETLLLSCLVHGTSHGESGSRVSIERKSGETVLFFVVDDQSNKGSNFRADCGMQEGDALCDCIVFFSRNGEATLCFVELKGNKIDRAIEQVIHTCKRLRASFENSTHGKKYCQKMKWKAYILAHGSSPIRTRPDEKRLEQTFEKKNFAINHNKDLGAFLRGVSKR